MMVIEHTAQRITAVAQQMPPVGDLNGLRRSLAGSIGVGLRISAKAPWRFGSNRPPFR